jgi:hypothetical protein
MVVEDALLIALKLIAEVIEEEPLEGLEYCNLSKLLKDAQECLNFPYCILCHITGRWPRQKSIILQQHHVAGKVQGNPNQPDTISVCQRCHDYLSDHQRSWLLYRKDQVTRLSCYFFGWADIFELLSNKSGLLYFERLGARFRSQGFYIRNRLPQRRHTVTGEIAI